MIEHHDVPLRVDGDAEHLAEVHPGGKLQRVGHRLELEHRRLAVVDSRTLLRRKWHQSEENRNGHHVNACHKNLLVTHEGPSASCLRAERAFVVKSSPALRTSPVAAPERSGHFSTAVRTV